MVGLCLSAACGGPADPSDEQQLLNENRGRFSSMVGASYAYDYSNVCFCLVDTTRPVRVVVRDRQVVSVTSIDDGAPVPRERWGDYLTVEQIFDAIQEAFDQNAASVRAVYDERLGYPRDVFIDLDERLADEERGFIVDNLQPEN